MAAEANQKDQKDLKNTKKEWTAEKELEFHRQSYLKWWKAVKEEDKTPEYLKKVLESYNKITKEEEEKDVDKYLSEALKKNKQALDKTYKPNS